ncbi:redoxin domain-containing protein [Dyadobacter sp. NIV53]|uniref:DUF6436 domain-containing protein n=1 Tax=Dyadobacter sp. NIV53 TaxID=2861765 RepID=UPI001C86B26F|nr:redoxin domain-containing protein [Dyadobacter sp. NIV53]
MLRKWILSLWLLVLLFGAISLFWYNDWVYQLPTPVPKNYIPVSIGHVIDFHGLSGYEKEKPVFIHFFNPDCPCSRFNIKHFQSLVRQYRSEVTFVVVVMSKKSYTAEAIRNKFGTNLKVLFDQDIAGYCGVYSTPQAVILNPDRKLYYRGNYNRSRYCTDEKTNFAKIALTGLLSNKSGNILDPLNSKSYGCSLPYCKN